MKFDKYMSRAAWVVAFCFFTWVAICYAIILGEAVL